MLVVFDLDGTLCCIEHRRHYVTSKPKNWKAFEKALPKDSLKESVAALYHLMVKSGATVILASGRSEDSRKDTEEWLEKHSLVGHVELLMRASGNYEADYIIKGRICDYIESNYGRIDVTFDDRDQVVNMWRDRGILCCQVAPGDF